MPTYTEHELREIAERGRRDPSSLSADEVRAICLWLQTGKKQ